MSPEKLEEIAASTAHPFQLYDEAAIRKNARELISTFSERFQGSDSILPSSVTESRDFENSDRGRIGLDCSVEAVHRKQVDSLMRTLFCTHRTTQLVRT